MKSYIPKQPKHTKERMEAKLDQKLVQKLEKYCQYLESDRDYVISQVLELAFKKDRAFTEWLKSGDSNHPAAQTHQPRLGSSAGEGEQR